MDKIIIPHDVTPKKFFAELFPKQFEYNRINNPIDDLSGTEMTVQYNIQGPNGGTWNYKIKAYDEIVVAEGPNEKAILTFNLKESDWRDIATGRNGFASREEIEKRTLKMRERREIMKNLKGKLNINLTRPENDPVIFSVVFNKAETMELSLSMQIEDYNDMITGKVGIPSLFIKDKVKIRGDILFALKLSQIQL